MKGTQFYLKKLYLKRKRIQVGWKKTMVPKFTRDMSMHAHMLACQKAKAYYKCFVPGGGIPLTSKVMRQGDMLVNDVQRLLYPIEKGGKKPTSLGAGHFCIHLNIIPFFKKIQLYRIPFWRIFQGPHVRRGWGQRQM